MEQNTAEAVNESKQRVRRSQAEVDAEKIQGYFDGLSLADKIKLVKELKADIQKEQDSLTASLELIKSSNL